MLRTGSVVRARPGRRLLTTALLLAPLGAGLLILERSPAASVAQQHVLGSSLRRADGGSTSPGGRMARAPRCLRAGPESPSSTEGGLLSGLAPVSVEAGTHPYAVAVSPDGRDAYVANYGSESVSQFSRDLETGQLTALSPAIVGAGVEPHSVAVSADGRNVYVADAGSNSISQYARDRGTGALAALSPATVATGGEPRSIAISPDGKNVYAADTGDTDGSDAAVSQYARNTQTGALTKLSPATVQAGKNPRFVVVSGDGKSVYVAAYGAGSVVGFARNARTGGLESKASYRTPGQPYSIAVSPDDENVYVAGYGTGVVAQYARSPVTGRLQALDPATVTAGEETHSVVVSPDGETVYAANGTPSGTVSQYYRDINTGALTPVVGNPIEVGAEPTAIALSPEGKSAYIANHRSAVISQYARSPLSELHPVVLLTNVFTRGDRVELEGLTSASLIGQQVEILSNDHARVGLTRVALDGVFSTTAPLPRPSARNGDDTQYSARIGKLRSPNFKLHRRLSLNPPVRSHGKLTLSGRVTPPLTGSLPSPSSIVVWRRVGCGRRTAVGRTKPAAGGRYSVTLPEPTGLVAAASYRTSTFVRRATGVTVFRTYSREELVQAR